MSEMRSMDLNADLGEGGAHDAAMIALASSANIACGGHAGNETTMREAAAACIAAGVAIGAHPGYEDAENFGRREMALSYGEVADMITRQIQRLAAVASTGVHHVKLHGALYHQAARDASLASAVAGAISKLLPGCIIFTPQGGALALTGNDAGLRVVAEGFADRRYTSGGGLVSRSEPDAVITDVDAAVAQAMDIALMRRVRTADGPLIPLHVETICIHGDTPRSLEILKAVRKALLHAGFAIRPVGW
jgi:5-oxoprolinase (ATP-hydrolysing) subunit A